jgi:hypothetical protein
MSVAFVQQPRQIHDQEQGQEHRGDQSQDQAEARNRDPENATGRLSDSLGDRLRVLLSLLGTLTVRVQPRAEGRVADVLDDRRERVDEVAGRADERRDEDERRRDREDDESEDDDQRGGSPAEVETALHKRDDWVEHQRGEQGEEEGQDRTSDRDERPDDADERGSDEHRPDGDVDVERPPSARQRARSTFLHSGAYSLAPPTPPVAAWRARILIADVPW